MKYPVLSFYLLCTLFANAQEVLNNNPPSVKWQKINTPNFRILYPRGFEEQAQRMANTFEHIRQAESKTLPVETRKISVLLQNQSSVSNGFVSLIPRRSEFFTMPPQDYNFSGTTEWLDQLAAHEFRHVVQFDKANTGFNRVLYYMFGPATLAAMSVTAVPQWFWEGDAVVTETAFTHGGRGRVPNFGLVFRTNLMEGRVFNYHKQYLRSYKHNIPDHYVFGYHMVSYLRERTNDPLIWDKVAGRAWRVPFIPFRFSSAMKRETGLFVKDLYNEMASDLRRKWEQQTAETSITPYEPVTARTSRAYTDYLYPQVLGDGSILVVKRGIGDISQFRILTEGEEKRSWTPGIINDSGMLSASGNYVVWNEFGYHPRWRMKTYSVIKMYNVTTRKLKVISVKTRYASAALSPDESKIVTVESNTGYQTSLVVLDTEGNVLKKLPNSQNAFYSMPRWSNDGTKIVALRTTGSGRTISLFSYPEGMETELLPYSYENVGHPVLHGNYLLYNSPVSGIDNIYVYDLSSMEKRQVTSSRYGAYNPCVSADGGHLYYNEQSRDGMDVVRIPFDPSSWKAVEVRKEPKSFYQLHTEQEGRPNLFDSIPQQRYPTRKHSKWSGIFNPYSWGAYFDTGLTQADIGISSQNILSTTSMKAGYLYDIGEQTGSWRVGMSYQGWFPIIDIDVKYGNRKLDEGNIQYYKIANGDTTLTTENLTFRWNEINAEAGFRIPLITTNSRYHGNFTFGNYVGYTRTEDLTNTITGAGRIITPQLPFYWYRTITGNGDLLYNHFQVSGYRLLKQSRRDINPTWGQTFALHGYGTPYGGDFTGKQFSFYTLLYFPGLFKHHSFWGYWGYQQSEIELLSRSSSSEDFKDNNTYFFRNQIPLPRGISTSRFEQFYSMSANYTLPVWYPDVALGPLVNFQRIRINVFLDYGSGISEFTNRVDSEEYLSTGVEVRADVNFFRLLDQFNVGFRYSYGIRPTQVTQFEFLLGTINF
jgi:hypothetical protein